MWRRASAVALLCAALALALAERAQMPAAPFVLSRYGRAPAAHRSAQRDRFLLVGRYGKRAGADAPLAPPPAAAGSDRDGWRYAPYAHYYQRVSEFADVSSGVN